MSRIATDAPFMGLLMTDNRDSTLIDPDAWERRDGQISDRIGYAAIFGVSFVFMIMIVTAFVYLNRFLVLGALLAWAVGLLLFGFIVWLGARSGKPRQS